METFEHPEIGTVLVENAGAAGRPGANSYAAAQYERDPAAAESLIALSLAPDAPITPVLASDGWWWRVTE